MDTYQLMYILFLVGLLSLCYVLGKRNDAFRKLSIILYIVINFVYLVWRSLYTLPALGWFSLLAGLFLLFTEFAGFTQGIVTGLLFWSKNKRIKIPMSKLEKLPTVDVLIATYNEPTDLLKRTIVATQLIDYPKELLTIYICDDGKREDVRRLCADLSINYLVRNSNDHAKAGNLNHALTCSNGEIVVTMDADMIPRANFLKETLGHFSNKETAFVQAPQAFYNDDPFQFNLFAVDNINNEQDFFMRLLESGKDRFNATMYVGSNALFRRYSLEKIGGFATGVITEDMATGMLLQAEGWETVFVNEVLAVGLAPETYKDLLKQRDRWCRGNIQVFRKWNPLKTKGLKPIQKLLYMDGIHYWFFGIHKIIYLLAPILYLVFGIIVLQAEFLELLTFWLPAFLSSQVFASLIANKKRTSMWTHIYDIALAPSMAWAILSELFLKKSRVFNVTRKGIQTNARQFLWRSSLFHIVLLILSVIGILRGSVGLFSEELVHLQANSIYINLFWMFYNTIGILVVMLIFFERPRYRSTERFSSTLKGQIRADHPVQARIEDINEKGARLIVDKTSIKDKMETIQLAIDDGPVFNCTVRWIDSKEKDLIEIGLEFEDVSIEGYRFIIKEIFSNPINHIGDKDYYRAGLIPISLRFLRQTKKEPLSKRRLSVREPIRSNGILTINNLRYNFAFIDAGPEGAQIKTKVNLNEGDRIQLEAPSENIFKKSAEVRWVKRRSGRRRIGLRFVDD